MASADTTRVQGTNDHGGAQIAVDNPAIGEGIANGAVQPV